MKRSINEEKVIEMAIAEKQRTWSFLYDTAPVPEEANNILLDGERVCASYAGCFFVDFNKDTHTNARYVFTDRRFILIRYYEFDFTDDQVSILSLPWKLVDSWHSDTTTEFNAERAKVYQEGKGAEWRNLGWEATLTIRTRVGEDWKFRIADRLVDDEKYLAEFDLMVANCVL